MKKKKKAQAQPFLNQSFCLVKKNPIPSVGILVVIVCSLIFLTVSLTKKEPRIEDQTPQITLTPSDENISLPNPDFKSGYSLESALKNRKTRLDFQTTPLSLKQVSQLLWAGQGVNVDWGDRTAPSAKSTYPLNLYLLAFSVDGLPAGQYQYLPGDRLLLHELKPIKKGDLRSLLFAHLNQSSFKDIPAVIVITGNMSKMAESYGGIPHDKEVYFEAGYTAQNIALQVENLRLGTSPTTNFDEIKLKEIITTSTDETILLLLPIGAPKQ